MKKEILKQLKSDYEKLEIKPSSDLWDRIEQTDQETDKMSDVGLKISSHWWKYAAVILLIISFGGFFYFNSNEKRQSNNRIVHSEDTSEVLRGSNIQNNIVITNTDQPRNVVSVNSSGKGGYKKINEEIKPKKTIQENLTANSQILVIKEKAITSNDLNKNLIIEDKNINHFVEIPVIAERKKVSYIKAEELLLGREFDKTREESEDDHRRFGVLDMGKIKIKSPSTFKILGVTIYSDSLETK